MDVYFVAHFQWANKPEEMRLYRMDDPALSDEVKAFLRSLAETRTSFFLSFHEAFRSYFLRTFGPDTWICPSAAASSVFYMLLSGPEEVKEVEGSSVSVAFHLFL